MIVDRHDVPAFRAAVLAEVAKAIMTVPGPVKACTVCSTVTKALQLPEEECSLEIFAAIFLLFRHGLILSDTDGDGLCCIAAETILTASPSLLAFTWMEPVMESGDA